MPFNILHVGKFYPPHAGGMETHLHDLVTGLVDRYSVHVLVANDGIHRQNERSGGARITRVAKFGTVASMPVTPALPWEISRQRTDLVHVHTPHPSAAFAVYVAQYRGPLIVTHHSDILGRDYLRLCVQPFIRHLMSRADRIIVTSQRYLESSKELDEYRQKCVVIPLAIGEAALAPCKSEEVAELRKVLGENLIIAVGRLVHYKGFEYAIRAMTRVSGMLAIVGTGPLETQLRNLVAELKLTKKVCFLGKVRDVRPYYAAAKVFVLPSVSRAEAFGLVQLEAMAAALPVVNTDIDSGVPEVSVMAELG